jgi:hypothetical protein
MLYLDFLRRCAAHPQHEDMTRAESKDNGFALRVARSPPSRILLPTPIARLPAQSFAAGAKRVL